MDDCENSYGPHQYVVSKSAYPCLSQIYMIKRGGRKIIIGENADTLEGGMRGIFLGGGVFFRREGGGIFVRGGGSS